MLQSQRWQKLSVSYGSYRHSKASTPEMFLL
jgi:hypothetical protein